MRLVDRERELAALDALLDDAERGSGGLILIAGEPGIGKTGLLRAAAERARGRGIRVHAARAGDLETDLAFEVARQLLADLVLPVDGGGLLDGAAALAAPVLSAVGPAAGAGGDEFAALHGLYWLTANLAASSPVLLTVDDAHWCDVPSLRYLAYLVRRVDGLRVALVVAARPDERSVQQELLDLLAAEPVAVTLRPAPLGLPALRSLLRESLNTAPEPAFVEACRSLTGGNPFLVRELLAEARNAHVLPLASQVGRLERLSPRGVRRAVLARISALPEGADPLARAAAVLGDATDARRAARLAGIPNGRIGALVEALAGARILEPSLALTFVHPLVRAAVLLGFGPAGAAAAHRAAAALLAEEGEPPEVLVPHLLATDPGADPVVVATLREAAGRADARGAPASAARYLARALAEPPAPGELAGVLFDLGVAEAKAGLPDAVEHLARAVQLADGPVARARAAHGHAWALALSGRVGDAVDACTAALDELGDRAPGLRQELELALVTAATQSREKRAVAATWQGRWRESGLPDGPAAAPLHAAMALEELLVLGSRERAVTAVERALQGGRLFTDQASVTLPSALMTLTLAGRARRAIAVWDEAIAVQRARGDLRSYFIAATFRAHACLYVGDLAGALADLQAAPDLAAVTGQLLSAGYATAWLAESLAESGDIAAAEKALAGQGVLFDPDAPFPGNYMYVARGRLHLALGRHREAAADLRECGHRLAAWGVSNPALCRWQAPLALALVGLGELAEAASVAAEAVDLARRWGAPEPLAEALRAAGVAAGGDRGLALLTEAVAVAERGESGLERAHGLVALGRALRRAGRRREAREPLRVAARLAAACGATPLANRAHEELLAAGARPRRPPTDRDGLTSTELRVARMAAEGMTNRAVAQALFVSEKTVETHLGRAYRKLGITTRTQLARALRSPSDAPDPVG